MLSKPIAGTVLAAAMIASAWSGLCLAKTQSLSTRDPAASDWRLSGGLC
jgi:hypothetical protein